MLQSKRGPLVLEVNSSPGLEGIEKATGLNIAGKIIEYTEQLSKRKTKPKVAGSAKAVAPMPDSESDVPQ
jgi:ribosomal protein S6--L-glutamate ligase